MKLFDAGKIISSSLGMAVAMSLSSLFLWKSDWLSVPSGSFHGSHGMGIVIGIVTSAAVMLWCSLSRRSLRRFGILDRHDKKEDLYEIIEKIFQPGK